MFNGVIRYFDPTSGYYRVKYEDDDSEDLSEDEALSVARVFRDYRRHRGTINSGTRVQDTVPRRTVVCKAVKEEKSSVHAIPADDGTTLLVTTPVAMSSVARMKGLIALCKTAIFFWGLVHLVYSVVSWIIGKN